MRAEFPNVWQTTRATGALAIALCGMLIACVLRTGETGYLLKKQTDVGIGAGDYNLGLDRDGNVVVTERSQVSIFSPDTGRIAARIFGLNDARATAIGNNRAFIVERRPNRLIAIDERTLQKLFEVPVGSDPSAVVLDRSSKRVFTLNEGSNDVTAIEANSGIRIGTVALEGRPRAAIGDGRGMLFITLIDKDEVAAFDAATLEVKFHRSLPGCSHPSGISADVAHSLIFSACENGAIAVSEMYSGRLVATIATAAETTEVKYELDHETDLRVEPTRHPNRRPRDKSEDV